MAEARLVEDLNKARFEHEIARLLSDGWEPSGNHSVTTYTRRAAGYAHTERVFLHSQLMIRADGPPAKEES
jgi:hypothetical protein